MKTFKFVATIVLLISVFIALMVVICMSGFWRIKKDENYSKQNKVRLISFAYIAAASVAIAILYFV